jgi:hypothetical protein
MATLRQAAVSLASLLGRPRVDGVLHARALVEAGLAAPGKPGAFGGLRSPATTPKQAAVLALSMSTGSLPKAAMREAQQFCELPLVSAYRAFQCDGGIQSMPIQSLEAVEGARFGDMLTAIVESYRAGIDPSDLRPGLQFAGCSYGAASAFMFGSLDWRALAPSDDGYVTSDHFSFLAPATVTPNAAIARQVSISAEVFARLGEILRPSSGGGGLGEVSTRIADETDRDDFEIAAAPGAIAAASCAVH